MTERNITLKLTMGECLLLSELMERSSYPQSFADIYNRLARSKARAIQRGCGRAPVKK